VTLVYVGGADLETAAQAFDEAGFAVGGGSGDRVIILDHDAAATLRAADERGERYVLVHVGEPDREPGGSYERAHHRVAREELPDLARRLRTRDRLLVRCVAFGYKHGPPADADWVVDGRFLDNPYWVEELRPLTGLDEKVRDYVLSQPGAGDLIAALGGELEKLLPLYRAQGRSQLTVAFGCTGGRHRSPVLATELASRLRKLEGVEVETDFREI